MLKKILCVQTMLLSLTLISFKQGVTPIFAQTPAGATLSLSVTPPVAYITIKPGETFTATVLLENEGTTSITTVPTLVDFEPDKAGTGIVLSDFTTFPYLDPEKPSELKQELRLQPGEKKTISIPIKTPHSASASEHHLTLLFPGSDQTNATDSPTGANISGVIGSNVIIMISPDIQDQSQLSLEKYEGVNLIDSFSPVTFKLWAKNEGRLAGIASGSAQLVGSKGNILGSWSFFPDVILAHSQRLLRTTGEKVAEPDGEIQPTTLFSFRSPFLIGKYQVKVTFGSANQLNRVTTEYPVIAFPFLLCGLILICGCSLIGYKIFVRKLPLGKRLQTY